MAMSKASSSTLVGLLVLMILSGECHADLRAGFYKGKCGMNDVESIVFNVVRAEFANDPTLAAALLRMQFHDCFVRGCDASILLDGSTTEKNAGPNGSVRGYDVIDNVKTALEQACPGLVSCADIIALATRAAVVLAGGKSYNVETGRRDGVDSIANDADSTLPGPEISVSDAIQVFASKGITKEDFVLLLGAHTTGIAHCNFFHDRLYNFNKISGQTDPNMSPSFVLVLKGICPINGDVSNAAFLDQSSSTSGNFVGNGFYKAILARKGVLQIDQMIALDPSTRPIVSKYAASNALFQKNFGLAMINLGRIGVLTGNQGQVRNSCRSVNS